MIGGRMLAAGRRSSLALLLGMMVLGAAARASAQPTTDDETEARALFTAGQSAFDRGYYERAVDSFRRAHALTGRPELLYNIGLAADRARMDADAIEAYEGFVAALPDHAQAEMVRRRLETIRRAQDHGSAPATGVAASAAPDDGASAAPERAPADDGPGPAPWILTSGGGVILAGGVVCLALGLVDDASVAGAPEGALWPSYRDAYERIEALEIAGVVGIITGAVALAVGVVWLASTPGTSSERASAGRRRADWRF
jgi:tetratricopeptide (TPR) repeat protein